MNKVLIALLAVTVITGCSRVNTGEVGIETTKEKVSSPPLSAGWYFFWPIYNKIHILNTRVQTVAQDSQAASSDLQNVQTQLTLNYHLGAEDPIGHYTRLGDDQTRIEITIVNPAMSEAFKAVVAQYTAEQLITKRREVRAAIQDTLAARLKQYDLYIDSVSITNFEFSPVFTAAIEAKQVAEQNANKAKNDLARITIEAQQKIVEAQAKAQAMQLQKQVVTPELIELKQMDIQSKMVDKWDGHFPATYMSGNNPMNLLNIKGN